MDSPLQLLLRVWPPMLAEPAVAGRLPESGFIYEAKYDGYRALAAIAQGRVAIQSRNGLDLARRFPTIADALLRIERPQVVLDGEIIAAGTGRFKELIEGSGPVRYCVFDLLWLDGVDLRALPLEARRALLDRIVGGAADIALAERLGTTASEALAEAHRRGFEGVVAKRVGSPYRGIRSSDWLKVKFHRTQQAAVVGYTPVSSGEAAIGALLLAVWQPPGFQYAGKVGTGFDSVTRTRLWQMLEAERVDRPPNLAPVPRERGARWVTPRLVAEVGFTAWTKDGHMLHPVFKGLRIDQRPEDCVRELVPPGGIP